MRKAAIVSLESEHCTRVVSFPEGVNLLRDSLVRIAWEKKGESIGKLLTGTMMLNESSYAELCKYINPCGTRIEFRAVAEIKMADKPFEAESPKRVLQSTFGTHYGDVGEPAGFKDKMGVDLFVGDVVHLFRSDGEYIEKKFVVKDEDGIAYVMGIKGHFVDPKTRDAGKFTVHLYKHHNQVADGEEYAGVRMAGEK